MLTSGVGASRRTAASRPALSSTAGRLQDLAVTAWVHNAKVTKVIFADGDEWADLTVAVHTAGRSTIVTRRGSALLLDLEGPEPRYLRVPLEGGHRMPFFDQDWLPISGAALTVTPCGVVVDHSHFWYRSTPIRLILEGLHQQWVTDSPYGRPTLETILAGRPPSSPGHDPDPCPALYCSRK